MDEELIFRASLQDNASSGLDQLRQKAQQTGQAVGQSGAAGASGLDVLNRSMSKSVGAANQFAAGSTSALGRFNTASNQAATVSTRSSSKIAAGFKRAAVGIVGAFGLIQVAMAGWRRLTGIEDARASLKGLGHDAAEVDKIMDNALKAVKGTAFALDEAAGVAASAVAAGIKPGEDLEKTLRLVADAATIGKTSIAEEGAIFNKVAAAGKLTAREIMQLNMQGIPILQFLGNTLHKTTDEVNKMVSSGQIGFDTFAKAMQAGLGGSALASGETTTGMIRNMGAALARLGATALEKVQPVAKEVFGSITEGADEAGAAIGSLFVGVEAVAGPFVRWWSSLPGPIKAVSAALLILVAFHSPLLRLLTSIGTPIRGLVANLRGMTAGFRGGAAAVGSFGWQMQLLQMRQGITGTAGMSKLGSFFTVAGRQAKAFGKSLLGAVGGPAGLAVTGALALITKGLMDMGEAQQAAAEAADAHKTAIEGLAAALSESAGDVSAKAVRDAALQNAKNAVFGGTRYGTGPKDSDISGLVDMVGGQFTLDDLINAQLGDQAAQKRITVGIDTTAGNMTSALGDGGWKYASKEQQDAYARLLTMGEAAKKLFDSQEPAMLQALNEHAAVAGISRTFTKTDVQDLIDAGKARDANDAYTQLAKSIGMVADAEKDAADVVDKATDSAKRWEDSTEAARKAMYNAMTSPPTNAVRDEWASIADATKDATDQAKTYQRLMDEMRGRPVALDDALQVFNDSNRALKEAVAAGTKSTHGRIETLIGKDGRINTSSEAGSKLRTDLRSWADQSATLVTAAYNDAINKGMTSDEANTAAQKAADTRLKAFRDAMAASKVEAPSVEAMIKDLGLDQPVESIYGPAALAKAQTDLVDAMTSAAQVGQAAAEQAGKSSEEAIDAGIRAGIEAASDWAQANGIDDIPVDLDTDPAYAAYGGLKAIVEKTLTARFSAQIQTMIQGPAPAWHPPMVAPDTNPAGEHIGHVVQAANGLVRNARIARGGSNILWAEPETGWEAYIPGAESKRARSEALMDVVARRFGGLYTPAAAIAKPMADGGITGTASGSRAGSITIGEVRVDARGATDPEAVGRAVRRELVAAIRDDRERSM